MKCEYCGKDFPKNFKGRTRKYCSIECNREADKANKRANYVGKREKVCRQCGKELPKYKTRFCSAICRSRWHAIQEGRSLDHGLLKKICTVCGKEFETQKSRQIVCSTECSIYRDNHKPYNAEHDRRKYLKKHPDAKSQAEIHEEYLKKLIVLEKEKEIKAIEHQKKEKQRAQIQAKREEIKRANIAYWLEYESEHICEDCGEKYIAHYPLAKYCQSCRKSRARDKYKSRYDGIMIDNDITLRKLARRDHNICWICGLLVDWTDKRPGNNTIIVGDLYPSIDHKIPISKGGMHAWNNVALAHMKCNSWKCDKII